jgi:3-oxocholest-4-en-26-oyl-CoA dehydrogenase alpha subunit
MNFGFGEDGEAFRPEVQAFLDEHLTDELRERCYRDGVLHDEGFVAAMRDNGWTAAGWPEEWGGIPMDPAKLRVLNEELSMVHAPIYALGTSKAVASALMHSGTEAQQREFIPKALRGELVIAFGFSEPDGGSDVAAAKTRAVRDGNEWVINGSKMFTTNAHVADYVFLLTRSNIDVPRHRGLTMFLVPMTQPGVDVQAVYTVSGERTNITFYADVRVPDSCRIGEVDGGWAVLTGALQEEHSVGFSAAMSHMLKGAEEWALTTADPDGGLRIDDPDVQSRLARCAAEVEVSRLLQERAAWMDDIGSVPEAEGPMAKLFSSEAMVRSSQDLVEMIGPDALRSYLSPTAPQHGVVEYSQRFSIGTTIYAGASEVQRNIIAFRGLKLPR